MNHVNTPAPALPDALISWTTAVALLVFGVIFLDDAVIMGKTILALGILSATNEGLKLYAAKRTEAAGGCSRVRLAVALVYAGLVLMGFLFPPASQ
jgi:hypothetical protein